MFCGRHADHNCHNRHSVAGVAHVEQEVAADGHDLQDGVDDDDDELVYNMIFDMIWWYDLYKMLLLTSTNYCFEHVQHEAHFYS